ncbi:hypothetical protein CN271_01535 [Bacillus cereus]|nr:hypothetical protein CON59_14350 [Bacillus cereus]PET45812.1 hypothetical protein CN523_14955 [Bacillus cereus]PFA53494.1 hypothetical protein CN389_19905 [Bacillus cereus]PFD80332.1 hypothetical protein CN271_01535 [Bacillus cereus]PFE84840.1 hypothetical protein CN319_00660 [Bacillus cereus]
MHYTKTLLWLSKGILLTLPTGEGAPQGLRGWGVRLMGSRGRLPLVGSDKVRGLLAVLSMARRSRQASQTPIDFDALASKYV